jgi:hypothetical protein
MNEKIDSQQQKSIMNGDLPDLMNRLHTIDNENVAKLRRMSILFAVLIVLYLALIIAHPTINLIIITVSFTVFLAVFIYSFRKTRKRDYSLPVKQLLIESRKSYRLVTPEYLVINAAAYTLIVVSFRTLSTEYFSLNLWGLTGDLAVLVVTTLFYTIMLVIGYLVWRATYHKLIRQIDVCLKDLDE